MPKRVSIPGYDKPIEFPDSMSPDEINAASKKLYDAKNPASTDPSGRTPTGEPAEGDDRNGFQRWADNLITPDPRKEEWQSPWKTGLDRAAQGVAENVLPIVAHPIDSAVGFAKQVGGAIANGGQQPGGAAAEFVRPMIEGAVADYMQNGPAKALPHILGQGAGMLATGELQGEALKAAGRRLSPILAKGNESLRQGIQSMVGAGDKPVRAEVAAKAAAAGKAAKATEESNRAEIKKHGEAVKEAGQKDVNAHVQYLADKAEADQANAAAKAIPDSRAGLESLANDKTEQADIRTEKARADSLIKGNKLYKEPNEILNPIELDTDMATSVESDTLKARQTLAGSETRLPIVDQIDAKLEEWRNHEKPMVYKDLAGFITELGAATSQGGLPGDVFKALDNLHESLQEKVRTLALEYDRDHGMEPTIKRKPSMPNEKGEMEPGDHYVTPHPDGIAAKVDAAREYWRRMKETFGKPRNKVLGRAGESVYDANPDYESKQKQEYTDRLTDYFDPEISKLNKEAAAAREKASKLSEGARPTAKAPDYPKPTEVAPPKTNPIKVPDVNTRNIREEFVRRWAHGEEKLNPFQVRSLIRGGLGPVIGAVIGEHFGGMGAAAGAIAGTAIGPAMVAKLVDMAPVTEWLTRPPAGELETFQSLPYADRIKITDGLKKVVSQAQKQGIKVSPALLTAIGYSAHPTPPALKGSPLDDQ